jgi:uncharacterized membrane protein YbhN (UPF0104 family)
VKRFAARALPFAVTTLLLGLLLRQVSLPVLVAQLEHAQPAWVAAGVVLYALVNGFRAVRFRLVMPGYDGGAASLMPVSFAVAFLNNVLPLRSGELSFVLLARARHDVSGAEATAALAVARLFDYIAVAALFVPLALASLPSLPPETDWPVPGVPTAWLIGAAAGMVLAGAIVALALASLGQRGLVLLGWVLARLGLAGHRFGDRAMSFGERTVAALAGLRTRHTYGRAFAVSLALWLVMFLWMYTLVRALGVTELPGRFVVGASFGVFAKSLPVPDVGGTGVAVTAWTLGFTLLGWPKELAISTGLAVAALTLAMSAAFGLASLAWLRSGRGRLPRRALQAREGAPGSNRSGPAGR